MIPVAIEIQNNINHVFQDFRAGYLTVFGDMSH